MLQQHGAVQPDFITAQCQAQPDRQYPQGNKHEQQEASVTDVRWKGDQGLLTSLSVPSTFLSSFKMARKKGMTQTQAATCIVDQIFLEEVLPSSTQKQGQADT